MVNKNIIFFLFAGKILRTKKLQRSVVATLYALIYCLLNFLKPFIHIMTPFELFNWRTVVKIFCLLRIFWV